MEAMERACNEVVGDWVNPDGPGCALAVIRDGEPAFIGAYGMADLEQGTPVSPSTRFLIGSVSKQFTGACAALAIEAGLFSPEDRLREFIPELAAFADPITVEHLIRHTSGLRDIVLLLFVAGWRDWDVTTHEDALELIFAQRQGNFAPGSSWSYSNTGYVLLAEILQRVTGKSFRALASEWIFEPLKMDATHVTDDPRELVVGRSRSYLPGADGEMRSAELNSGLIGTGGISSTVEDLSRWDANFRTGAVGGEAFLTRITTPGTLADGRPIGYGYGLFTGEIDGRPTIEHGGWQGGWVAHLLRLPTEGLTIIICSNVMTTPVSAIAVAISRRLLDGGSAGVKVDSAGAAAIPEGVFRDRESGILTRLRTAEGRTLLGFGDGPPTAYEPMDFVAPPRPLHPDDDGRHATIGVDDREHLSLSADGTELHIHSQYAALPKTFDRIEELGRLPGITRRLGRFRSEELGASLEASLDEGWLTLSGRRFGPIRLEPVDRTHFAASGLTVELQGDPTAPDALILDSNGMRDLRFGALVSDPSPTATVAG